MAPCLGDVGAGRSVRPGAPGSFGLAELGLVLLNIPQGPAPPLSKDQYGGSGQPPLGGPGPREQVIHLVHRM